MQDRCEESVLEAEKEIETALKSIYSKLPSIPAGEYAEELSVYTDTDGNQAVVPAGGTVSRVKTEDTIWGKDMGLVIYCLPKRKEGIIDWEDKDKVKFLMETYNQLVWLPVGKLDANGTLDGVSFTEKLGRRNYPNGKFYRPKFEEFGDPMTGEFAHQVISANGYGGFYITRYNISKNERTGEPQSVKGKMPWTRSCLNDAKRIAATVEKSDTITTHLPFGAEHDSVLEWFIKSGAKTRSEIVEDSTELGNHYDSKNFLTHGVVGSSEGCVWDAYFNEKIMLKTGSRKEYCINNIYDFIGNVSEYTQEESYQYGIKVGVCRGGTFEASGKIYPASCRAKIDITKTFYSIGFRAAFDIKLPT